MARGGLTNAGKKEQRQINQLLNKPMSTGNTGIKKEVEARTVPKGHSMKGAKQGK